MNPKHIAVLFHIDFHFKDQISTKKYFSLKLKIKILDPI